MGNHYNNHVDNCCYCSNDYRTDSMNVMEIPKEEYYKVPEQVRIEALLYTFTQGYMIFEQKGTVLIVPLTRL